MILPLNMNPASLLIQGDRSYGAIGELYQRYQSDLKAVVTAQANVISGMKEKGQRADFGDVEAELLYLLIREFKPSVVVEVSPNNGYSTGYILAALAANDSGKLFSYEIIDSVSVEPIEDVIRSNLSPLADPSRFELIIGDARDACIPDADFLLIDSSHEAHFAAWYARELIPRAKWCFVHDIVANSENEIVLKAPARGIMESHHVLETLSLNGQSFFACLDFGLHSGGARHGATARYDAPNALLRDRSIVFPGHSQSIAAERLHDAQISILKALVDGFEGERLGACKVFNEIVSSPDQSHFAKSSAIRAAAILGYRMPFQANVYQGVDANWDDVTISSLAAALEAASLSGDTKAMTCLMERQFGDDISPAAVSDLRQKYAAMTLGSTQEQQNWLMSLLRRIGGG
tara:strand:- start:30969 stop:32183 length:1215 start_codon:yes stop_codon:yes gene_type:complete